MSTGSDVSCRLLDAAPQVHRDTSSSKDLCKRDGVLGRHQIKKVSIPPVCLLGAFESLSLHHTPKSAASW